MQLLDVQAYIYIYIYICIYYMYIYIYTPCYTIYSLMDLFINCIQLYFVFFVNVYSCFFSDLYMFFSCFGSRVEEVTLRDLPVKLSSLPPRWLHARAEGSS